MNKDFWGKIQEELQETIGKNNFTNWISPLEFSEVIDGVAIFKVPTTFLGNYVSQNFGDIILFKLNNIDRCITRISFKVNTDDLTKKSNLENEKKVSKSTKKRSDVIPGAPLDPRFTFDSFIVGKPNELAHAAARRVADGAAEESAGRAHGGRVGGGPRRQRARLLRLARAPDGQMSGRGGRERCGGRVSKISVGTRLAHAYTARRRRHLILTPSPHNHTHSTPSRPCV